MIKGGISLGIFILIGIVAWWTITSNDKAGDQAKQANADHFISAYMNDFEMTAMDATGVPSYTLTGAYMERFNNSDETRIQLPVFQLLQTNKQWKVSADSAIVHDKQETILLSNNVIMQQQNVATEITIHATHLLIHTKKQIAETKTQVNITQGNSKLSSNGMIFNNITNELKLTSNVHGNIISND